MARGRVEVIQRHPSLILTLPLSPYLATLDLAPAIWVAWLMGAGQARGSQAGTGTGG